MEHMDTDAAVVVLQEGPDEMWIFNSLYQDDLGTVVAATSKILEGLDVPRRLPPRLRLARWLVGPVCRRVHTCT